MYRDREPRLKQIFQTQLCQNNILNSSTLNITDIKFYFQF